MLLTSTEASKESSKESRASAKDLKARIITGSIVLLSGSSLATLVNLAYNVAVARFLGAKGFGHATAVYTLLTLTSAVTLSFQIVTTKFVAKQSSPQIRDAAYRTLHRASWMCGAAVAFGLLLFRQSITTYLNLPTNVLVVFLAVGAAFYIPLGSRRGYIQGAFGFSSLAKNLVLEGMVRLFGSLLLIALGFGVRGVVAANALAMAIAYLAIAPKLVANLGHARLPGYGTHEIVQAMIFFAGQVLINNCDIVLVKHFFLPELAGLYAAIAMVGRVTFSFSTAIVNSMFPVVAGSGDEERKSLSLIATSLALVMVVGGAFALALRLTPAWVWTRFFGASFHLPGPHGFPFLLALYAITTVIYSLSVVIITYEMAYKIANTSWLQLAFSGLVIACICKFHASLEQVVLVQLVLMIVLLVAVAVPFLIDAWRRNRATASSSARTIRVLGRITEDEVISEFMKSDFENVAYTKYQDRLRKIVFAPNLDDPRECAERRALLFLRHRALWKELPTDTVWYDVEVVTANLHQIRVFPRAHWRKIAGGNFAFNKILSNMQAWDKTQRDPFIEKIADIRQHLSHQQLSARTVVLIGLNELEPLTILDGNHRFVAGAIEGHLDRLRFVCGLSPSMNRCCWYTTNLFNLTRYARNLARHVVRHPEADLKRLFEASN